MLHKRSIEFAAIKDSHMELNLCCTYSSKFKATCYLYFKQWQYCTGLTRCYRLYLLFVKPFHLMGHTFT